MSSDAAAPAGGGSLEQARLGQVRAGSGRAALAWATESLAAVPTPDADARVLVAFCAGLSQSELAKALIMGAPVWDAGGADRFIELVGKRATRIPLQYLTGLAPFRYLELEVGPGVFVPRPETEVVAQVAIDFLQGLGRPTLVADLCTGSGAIALAVLTEVPDACVHAVELSADAFSFTERNVAAHPAPDGRRVTLVKGDARRALGELNGTLDAVISNPPYVPADAVPKDEEVARHDPAIALYGLGNDGLEVPRGVTNAAARLLAPGGLYVMEHAEVQAAPARDMVAATGYFDTPATEEDLTGRDRMVRAVRNYVPYVEGLPL